MAYKTNEILVFDDYAILKFHNSDNIGFIDVEDVEKVQKYCFYVDDKGYARARKGNTKIFLHHLIIGKPSNRIGSRPYKQKPIRQ